MTRRNFAASIAAFSIPLRAQESRAFDSLANDYIAEVLKTAPEFATYVGEHRYDDRLSDPAPEARRRYVEMLRSFLGRAQKLNAGRLDPVSRIDLRILISNIESTLWSETMLREREWNPMTYNPGNAIYYLLEREFAPREVRLASVNKRLEAVPAYLAAARRALGTATKVHTETAVGQIDGTIRLITTQAPESKAREQAVTALKDWREFLQREVLPKANRDFRIGAELYRAKLRHTLQSGLTRQQIRARGEADLKTTQAAMQEIARKLGSASIKSALDKIADHRPTADTIVSLAKQDLGESTAFVKEHRLVTVFESPLKIVEMPEFQRGVAVATCASPGPLEKNGITFFNISPPPSNWNQTQVDSYFREYNDAMTRNLVVHEAMPGHYLQRAHANRFQAPTLTRAIFSSGTFTEGWAVYAEKVMADAGYGGPEVRMQQLKMRLRTIINALIDQGIQAGGMTEQQAMDLMMNEGFQEKSEAAGKWKRAMLTSAQLSTYYVGTTELDQLREDYVRRNGPIKDQQAFHDRMLSFGSPAPRYVRELMGLPAA